MLVSWKELFKHTRVEVSLHQSEKISGCGIFCQLYNPWRFCLPDWGEDAVPVGTHPVLSAPGTWSDMGGLWWEQREADFLGVCFCLPQQKGDSDFSSRSCNSANNNTL